MRIPASLASLADLGIIEEVVRPLMSGKEAHVYLVVAGGEPRVAKIYKDAEHRTFKHRAEYTEGRKTRNTRDQRAIGKRTAHGRAQDEAAWRSTEVDTIHRLHQAGVRVPVPYNFIDGVLVMELVTDAAGQPAPRLAEVPLDGVQATAIYEHLLREVVRMLCAGVVHGDLSEFNVLMAADGPVIIDFPQSVDPAHNPNARKLLVRDVDNLHDFLGRLVRPAQRRQFAEEMWELYEANGLTPETPLTGRYRASSHAVDTASVLALIDEANRDERRRREYLGIKGGPAEAAAQPRAAAGREGQRPGRFEGQRGAGRGRGMPSGTTKAAEGARAAGQARAMDGARAKGPARAMDGATATGAARTMEGARATGATGASRNDQHGRTNAGANARPDAQRPRHGQQRAQPRKQQQSQDERSARSHMPQQPRSPLHADRPPSRMSERPSHGSRPPLPNEPPSHGGRPFAPSQPNNRASHRSRASSRMEERPSHGSRPPLPNEPPSHGNRSPAQPNPRPSPAHTPPSRSHVPPSHPGAQTRANERPPHKHTAPSRPHAPHTHGQRNAQSTRTNRQQMQPSARPPRANPPATRASTGAADTRPTQGPDGAPAGRRARRRHRKGPPPTRGF